MWQKIPIAFLGGGNITSSLVNGLIKNGYPREKIIVSNRGKEKLLKFKELGVQTAKNNVEAIEFAKTVFLAVKPQFVKDVCLEASEIIAHQKPLIISLVTATKIQDIINCLSIDKLPVVRTMTNLTTAIGLGTTAMFANSYVNPVEKQLTENIFNLTGNSFWTNKEADLISLTPLIGCGPAYLFLHIEAIKRAAIEHGIDKETAIKAALQMTLGSAQLAHQSSASIEELRKMVTTPNGVTERALEPIIQGNYFDLFKQAFSAANTRCQEIEDQNKQFFYFKQRRNAMKFIIMLSREVKLGQALNALGHMTLGLGHRIKGEPDVLVFFGDAEQVRKFRTLAANVTQVNGESAAFTDFPHTMSGGSTDEQEKIIQLIPEEKLTYYGACFATDAIDSELAKLLDSCVCLTEYQAYTSESESLLLPPLEDRSHTGKRDKKMVLLLTSKLPLEKTINSIVLACLNIGSKVKTSDLHLLPLIDNDGNRHDNISYHNFPVIKAEKPKHIQMLKNSATSDIVVTTLDEGDGPAVTVAFGKQADVDKIFPREQTRLFNDELKKNALVTAKKIVNSIPVNSQSIELPITQVIKPPSKNRVSPTQHTRFFSQVAKEEELPVEKKVKEPKLVPHTFVFRGNADCVHLAGSFNDWLQAKDGKIVVNNETNVYQLYSISNEENYWATTLYLPPGRYEFKFVINGGTSWSLANTKLEQPYFNNTYPTCSSDGRYYNSSVQLPEIDEENKNTTYTCPKCHV